MSSKVFVIFFLAILPMAFLAPPVFLSRGGSKICTLNTIGKIPAGSVKYPVYQKVCRQVYPALGDFAEDEDDEKDFLSDEDESRNDEAEKIVMAILGAERLEKPKKKCNRQN